MPDLISHALFGHLLRRGYGLASGRTPSRSLLTLFYLGIILPDVLTRPVYIIFPSSHAWTLPLHTPFGMLLACMFIALLFDPSIRRKVFISLFTGVIIHFLLDLFQKQIVPSNYWFFPLNWNTAQLGVIWAGDFILLIPYSVVGIGVGELTFYLYQKKRRDR